MQQTVVSYRLLSSVLPFSGFRGFRASRGFRVFTVFVPSVVFVVFAFFVFRVFRGCPSFRVLAACAVLAVFEFLPLMSPC